VFSQSFDKTANGDMIEYFNQNPKKHEEWKERQEAKKKLKAKKKSRKINKQELARFGPKGMG
jgi:LPS O-antigen subunit length determinant protein (WzzB/FepE family)